MTPKYSQFLEPTPSASEKISGLVPGLVFRDSYRGSLKCGSRAAAVFLEGAGWLRVSLPVEMEKVPEDALRANSSFPGNARFAFDDAGSRLVADSMLDGLRHLPASIGELRAVLRNGGKISAGSRARIREAVDEEDVRKALSDSSWTGGDVVPLKSGWEVRPRLRGQPVAVQLTVADASVRLRRTLATRWPADVRSAAAAVEALRLNADLRLCRLTLDGETLCVESRLHQGLVEPSWLAVAVRAVAVAFQHAHKSLQVLLDDPCVAESYLQFLSR